MKRKQNLKDAHIFSPNSRVRRHPGINKRCKLQSSPARLRRYAVDVKRKHLEKKASFLFIEKYSVNPAVQDVITNNPTVQQTCLSKEEVDELCASLKRHTIDNDKKVFLT